MFTVKGTQFEAGALGDMRPLRVLVAYDGPRTFVCADPQGGLLLAHFSDEDDSAARFIVAASSEAIIDALDRGEMTLYEALDQPWVWITDLGHAKDGERTAWRVRLADIPADALPARGLMLRFDLQPLVTVRATGHAIQKGDVRVGVLRRLAQALEEGVRDVVDIVAEDIPRASLAVLRDLRVQRIAFGSFELALREGRLAEPRQLNLGIPEPPDIQREPERGTSPGDGSVDENLEDEAFNRVRQLFTAGLTWAANPEAPALSDSFDDIDEGRAVLIAIRDLLPEAESDVEDVEVGGRLVDSQPEPTVHLDQGARRRVRAQTATVMLPEPEVFTMEGRIGEMDWDKKTFMLRDISGGERERKFAYDDLFIVPVRDNLNRRVRVQARTRKRGGARVIALTPLP